MDLTNRETWVNHLLDLYRDLNTLNGQLLTHPPNVLHETEVYNFPDSSVRYNVDTSEISIIFDDVIVGSSTKSIGPGLTTLTYEEFRTFVHDFTFSMFTEVTDMRLETAFDKVNDGANHLTPDLIIKTLQGTVVVEFATQRNLNNMLRVYETKKTTYFDVIKTRVRREKEPDKKYGFHVIVVGVDRVVSDLYLHPDIVNELTARFRCATEIMMRASQQGYVERDSRLDAIKQQIHSKLGSIKMSWDDGPRKFSKAALETENDMESTCYSYSKFLYLKCLNKSPQVLDEGVFHCNETPDGFYSSHEARGTKITMKPISKFPGWDLKSDEETLELAGSPVIDPYSRLWNEVIDQINIRDDLNLNGFDQAEIYSVLDRKSDDDRPDKRDFNRLIINMTSDDCFVFAERGVGKKQVKKSNMLDEVERRSKVSLSMGCDTSDMDKFFLEGYWEESTESSNIDLDLFKSLVKESQKCYDNCPKDSMDELKWIMGTRLFNWCQNMSTIAMELCISQRQHCKRNEFVLKRLRYSNCYMLIKPTNSSSHTFFSLMIPKGGVNDIDESTLFSPTLDMGTYFCTKFYSFNTSKLTNMVQLPSLLIALLAQWCRLFEVDPTTEVRDKRVWSLTKLGLLISLDDKHLTEEVFTLMRYVCMEKFSILEESKYKMIKKLPEVIRSRLQLWGTKKLFEAMESKVYVAKFVKEKDVGHYEYKNLTDPYFGYHLSSVGQLIEFFYLGYVKNKNEVSNANADCQLIRKVLKYEMDLGKTCGNYFGLKDPIKTGNADLDVEVEVDDTFSSRGEQMMVHEWSRSAVLAAADSLCRSLKKQLGTSWRDKLENDIQERLKRITWESIATLKATSNFIPDDSIDLTSNTTLTKETLNSIRVSRSKVAIKVMQVMDLLDETPMLSLNKAICYLESAGGLLIDLFKKNQHGGLREIYVLDIYSRIVQLSLEEISKAYCVYFPMEMMTHPEAKLTRPQHHIYEAQSKANDETKHYSISSSNDASKWNQGHHVLKFAQFMSRLLPNSYKDYYYRAMKLWTSKQIKLPDGVISLLLKSDQPDLSNEVDRALRDGFFTGEYPWSRKGKPFVVIESGMMQGILHYTSSLFHVGVLTLRNAIFMEIMRSKGFICKSLDMVSSDDSARVVDVYHVDDAKAKLARTLAILDQVCIKDFSRFFGIEVSEKSTFCTTMLMEFNSEWFVGANLERPTLKWATASLVMTEVEALFERQEISYNALTELLEGGSGFKQAKITQFAQALQHYKLLGLGVNPYFGVHARSLLDTPDPTLGFFLLDHWLSAGLIGLGFSHYHLLLGNDNVNQRYNSYFSSKELTITGTGSITRGCLIRYGNAEKARRLIRKAEECNPDWRVDIETSPKQLYVIPRTKKECQNRIMNKLTSPSVMTSLSSANCLARMIASSVYLLSENCVTLSSCWLDDLTQDESDYLNANKGKTSLLYEINRQLKGQRLSNLQLDLLFPARDYYNHYSALLSEFHKGYLVDSDDRKSLRSHIKISQGANSYAFSLESMVKWKWFEEALACSERVLNTIWDQYTAMIPWLRSTIEETLENSPGFKSHIQLRNFIARIGDKSRTVHLTASPVRDLQYGDVFSNVVRRNQYPGKILSLKESPASTGFVGEYLTLAHRITSVAISSLTDEQKTLAMIDQCRSSNDIVSRATNITKSNRMAVLSLIQEIAKRKENLSRTCTKIELLRLGVFGGFTQRQHRKVDGTWYGSGTWRGRVADVEVMLYMSNGLLNEVICSDVSELRKHSKLFHQLMLDMRLEVPLHPNINKLTRFYYDGKSITASGGVPIKETSSMSRHYFVPENLYIKFFNGALRIVYTDHYSESNLDISYLTFPIRDSDYNYSLTSPYRPGWSKELKCIMTNEPLPIDLAYKFLELNPTILARRSGEVIINSERLRENNKVRLQASLLKHGWLERYSDLISTKQADEHEFNMQDIFDIVAPIDVLDNLGEIEQEHKDSWDYLPELQFFDSECLNDLFTQRPNKDLDARRYSNMYDRLVNHWDQVVPKSEKKLLLSHKYTKETERIAAILTDTCNWKMTCSSLNYDDTIHVASEESDEEEGDELLAELKQLAGSDKLI